MDLTSASFAYPRLDGPTRATVAGALTLRSQPVDAFVLSTCLRVEVVVRGDETELKDALDALLGPLPAEPVIRTDAEAVLHLFRVAAGLESPIIGEIEILTQFRAAVGAVKDGGDPDSALLRLLEAAVAVGRTARARLDSSPHDTMAAIAAQVVGAFASVAVLGSGTMAAAVVGALAALPVPPRVVVVARSPEKVPIPGTELVPIEDLARVLGGFPAVISATAASTELLDPEELASTLSERADRLTLVDMAMPPDFTPAGDTPVDYVGIDCLAEMAWRRPRTTAMEELVSRGAIDAYHRYSGEPRIAPIIARLMEGADAIVNDTVDRFAGRLADPADLDVMRQAAHTVARTILARPVTAVRASRDPGFVDAIAAAFVEDD